MKEVTFRLLTDFVLFFCAFIVAGYVFPYREPYPYIRPTPPVRNLGSERTVDIAVDENGNPRWVLRRDLIQ
jgi:hypothetical protein